MSNFRLLGKAMIDFARVRAVRCEPASLEDQSDTGMRIIYGDGQEDFIFDETPAETLKRCYAEWQAQDEAHDRLAVPALCGSEPVN